MRVTLTGKAAEEFVAQLRARNVKARSEALVKAKAEAALMGKQSFDLEKLEAIVDTSSEGKMLPEDERRAKYEEMYYVEYPDVMTIEEFAEKVAEWSSW